MKPTNLVMTLFATTMLLSAGTAKASFITDQSSTPVLIGAITAGTSYTVTASGISDLNDNFNGPQGATFTADGKPTYDFPSPYSAFYPNGLDYDPSQSTTAYGVGGQGKLYGALLGTFTATPTASDFFTIGLGTTFTATTTGDLYGVVNDCSNCYGDNSGGYTATLNAQVVSAVPLPASAPMFGGALLILSALGYGMKRKMTISEV